MQIVLPLALPQRRRIGQHHRSAATMIHGDVEMVLAVARKCDLLDYGRRPKFFNRDFTS